MMASHGASLVDARSRLVNGLAELSEAVEEAIASGVAVLILPVELMLSRLAAVLGPNVTDRQFTHAQITKAGLLCSSDHLQSWAARKIIAADSVTRVGIDGLKLKLKRGEHRGRRLYSFENVIHIAFVAELVRLGLTPARAVSVCPAEEIRQILSAEYLIYMPEARPVSFLEPVVLPVIEPGEPSCGGLS